MTKTTFMYPELPYSYADDKPFEGKAPADIFQEIYRNNIWSAAESVSGPGSTQEQTREIVRQLPGVLAKFHIKSFLDVPCGDFNWMKEVDLGTTVYTGGDIVAELAIRNQDLFGSPLRRFLQLDILQDEIPAHDLIFCRDCLVHFSFSDIQKAVTQFKNSHSTYLLTTTFPAQDAQVDIHTGGWRTLNLQSAPFHFPEPLLLINEHCTEMDGIYADKSLGLWRLSDIGL